MTEYAFYFFFFFLSLGGNKGFDKQIWDVVEYKKDEKITFKYHSHDNEEGNYPTF